MTLTTWIGRGRPHDDREGRDTVGTELFGVIGVCLDLLRVSFNDTTQPHSFIFFICSYLHFLHSLFTLVYMVPLCFMYMTHHDSDAPLCI